MGSDITFLPDFAPPPNRPERVTKPPPWGWLITADLMFSELSSGIFAIAALSDLVAHDVYGTAARTGYLIAFPLILGDLFCLIADLGDPLRFHHMMRVIKLRSPMSTGVWVISFFSLISFICFLLAAIAPGLTLPRLVLAGIGIAPALFVGGYKGVLFSATAQADWKDSRWLGAELATSAALLGISGLLLVALFLPVPAATDGMRRVQIALLIVNFAFTIPFFVHLAGQPLSEISPARAGMYVALIVLGWFLPLALSLIGGIAELAASACLILMAAIVFRRDLVILPHRAAAAGLALDNVRSDGWSAARADQPD